MDNTSVKRLHLKGFYMPKEDDDDIMANIDMDALEKGIEQAEKEIAEGKGIEFRQAMAEIHKEVFGGKI